MPSEPPLTAEQCAKIQTAAGIILGFVDLVNGEGDGGYYRRQQVYDLLARARVPNMVLPKTWTKEEGRRFVREVAKYACRELDRL